MDQWWHYNSNAYQYCILLPGSEWDCSSPLLSMHLMLHALEDRKNVYYVIMSHRKASSNYVLLNFVSFISFPFLDDQLLIKTIFCYAKYFLKGALYQTRNDLRMQLKFWIDFQVFENMGQCKWKRGKSKTSKAILGIGLLILCSQVFCWNSYIKL